MISSQAANRYAGALFDLAKEKGVLEDTRAELETVKNVFQDNEQLLALLHHPKVSHEKKEQLLREGFAGASELVQNMLLLLLEKDRIDNIVLVAESFQQLADEEQKVGHAVVSTVKPLSESERTLISEKFAKKVGKDTLYIENQIDPQLVGGIKVQIGDTIFDGSVKGQLNRMERELVSGKR
ncbi:ATP synthase F1 subcomplex delta subunit [Alteribacillus persepolensis]|uniref:ATP synthase subunit delta n=1 Tax=Alteribacillus persepolensis TaxID=568899 RepID=A0A1G8HC62_9BACI|nr:F0F1 ATP synthase subunit delta [Alteribacillus persepolensis]SDI04081.1 ATP synthase F1 subcomplex delta subunit [Alteribacillus persepolensis]